jgi:hypothetical protein
MIARLDSPFSEVKSAKFFLSTSGKWFMSFFAENRFLWIALVRFQIFEIGLRLRKFWPEQWVKKWVEDISEEQIGVTKNDRLEWEHFDNRNLFSIPRLNERSQKIPIEEDFKILWRNVFIFCCELKDCSYSELFGIAILYLPNLPTRDI